MPAAAAYLSEQLGRKVDVSDLKQAELDWKALQAYSWFKRAILVSIFLTQVFLFYTQQLLALGALLLNLLVLAALNTLIGAQQQETWHAVLQRTNAS